MTGQFDMDRLSGLNRLFAALQQVTDLGQVVPCTVTARSYLWLSEDPEDQAAASHGCQPCPALPACRAYVTQFPEASGVWAGRPSSVKRGKR